ncbi:MAG: galactokinase [Candidatus Sumerlaeia bacterium]|nr:galactokinase [Candidatus Sumerlaeia bacterium]
MLAYDSPTLSLPARTSVHLFRSTFGCEPQALIRAPGRVNLIGEHTDYNGLPVLPFAIAQSHYVAAAVGQGPCFELINADAQFPAKTIAADALPAFSAAGQWDNYFRAAVLGLRDAGFLTTEHLAGGMQIAVASDLPSGVGLSSSSALVVAFALAALSVHACRSVHPVPLAEILAEAEHYVGTRGGGMDQTVCLLGKKAHAIRINFFPLEAEPIPFCAGSQPVPRICLSDSGVRVEKSGTGLLRYNRRPLECRLALEVFRRRAASMPDRLPPLDSIRHWGDLVKPPIALSHKAVLEAAAAIFDHPSYSKSDLLRILGWGEGTWADFTESFPEPADGFKLHPRVRHVMEEGRRVEQAADALRAGDWPTMAKLIAASHESCRDLYEISCPEIERLIETGANAGATASRLTGAGFGGCVLHLVPADACGSFDNEMRRQLGRDLRLFEAVPSQGAAIL